MAIVRVSHVENLMRKEECPFWRLTDSAGVRNMIAENDDEDNVDTAIELMQEALNEIEDNYVRVMISNKSKKEKAKGGRSYKQFEFRVNLHKTDNGLSGASTGMLGLLLTQMEKTNQLQVQFMELQKERQFDELRRELKELKEGGKGAEKYLPYLNKIFGIEQPVGIASVGENDTEVKQDIVDKQKKVKAALTRLAKVDANLPDTLTRLANFAEKSPDEYRFYLTKL